jgi:hypothetical protein
MIGREFAQGRSGPPGMLRVKRETTSINLRSIDHAIAEVIFSRLTRRRREINDPASPVAELIFLPKRYFALQGGLYEKTLPPWAAVSRPNQK